MGFHKWVEFDFLCLLLAVDNVHEEFLILVSGILDAVRHYGIGSRLHRSPGWEIIVIEPI